MVQLRLAFPCTPPEIANAGTEDLDPGAHGVGSNASALSKKKPTRRQEPPYSRRTAGVRCCARRSCLCSAPVPPCDLDPLLLRPLSKQRRKSRGSRQSVSRESLSSRPQTHHGVPWERVAGQPYGPPCQARQTVSAGGAFFTHHGGGLEAIRPEAALPPVRGGNLSSVSGAVLFEEAQQWSSSLSARQRPPRASMPPPATAQPQGEEDVGRGSGGSASFCSAHVSAPGGAADPPTTPRIVNSPEEGATTQTSSMTTSRSNRLANCFRSTKRERLVKLETRSLTKAQAARAQRQKKEHRQRFEELPDREQKSIQSAFNAIDEFKNNAVDANQAVDVLFELGVAGVTATERREILACCKDAVMDCAMLAGRWNPLEPEKTIPTVNVYEFALMVLPQVRQRVMQLRTGFLLKEFFRHDLDRDGRLNSRELLDVARNLGIDARLAMKELEKSGDNSLGFEGFQEVVSYGRELLDRSLRERERQVKNREKIEEQMFTEFRRDLATLYDSFVRYDIDESGVLSHDEVMLMLKECGLMPKTKKEREDIDKLLLRADKDGSGEFNFKEFLVVVRSIRIWRQVYIRDDQQVCFDHYDKDHGKELSISEISLLLADLGIAPRNRVEQEELALMIHAADEDGSGTLNFVEFQDLSQRIDEKLKQLRYEQEVDCAMGNGFTEVQMRDFRWVFDSLDVDGSDKLSAEEVHSCLTLMGREVPRDTFGYYFRQLDGDESGELDFCEFLDFMRIMRDGEGFFSDEPHRLPSNPGELDLRVLRRTLKIFRISKGYLLSMTPFDLVELFCEYMGVQPTDNMQKALGVTTVKDLYDVAQRKNLAMQLCEDESP